jgi:hypothetical protein
LAGVEVVVISEVGLEGELREIDTVTRFNLFGLLRLELRLELGLGLGLLVDVQLLHELLLEGNLGLGLLIDLQLLHELLLEEKWLGFLLSWLLLDLLLGALFLLLLLLDLLLEHLELGLDADWLLLVFLDSFLLGVLLEASCVGNESFIELGVLVEEIFILFDDCG